MRTINTCWLPLPAPFTHSLPILQKRTRTPITMTLMTTTLKIKKITLNLEILLLKDNPSTMYPRSRTMKVPSLHVERERGRVRGTSHSWRRSWRRSSCGAVRRYLRYLRSWTWLRHRCTSGGGTRLGKDRSKSWITTINKSLGTSRKIWKTVWTLCSLAPMSSVVTPVDLDFKRLQAQEAVHKVQR